jgi:predicted PurR-regulated permease PerM
MGIVMTMLIGVASLLIAGLLIGGFLGFIVAIVIGVVLVGLWSRFVEPRRQPRWRQALHL